jgi:riboflavin kinase
MNQNIPKTHTIFVNLDLFFDFYSALFSAYRTYFAKQSISISTLKHCIEGKNFHDGLNDLIQEVSQGSDLAQVKEELLPFLKISLSTIKPIISSFSLAKYLTENGITIKTFTNFEEEVLKYIKETQKEWFNFEIIQTKNLPDLGNVEKNEVVLINSSIEGCLKASTEEGVCTVFVPHSKRVFEKLIKDEKLKEIFESNGIYIYEALENIEWNKVGNFGVLKTIEYPKPSFYLQLETKPVNMEYQIWKNVSKLEKPIELMSRIVHGFGRGGKKLGIPTANLDMTPEIEEKLVDLVSGVYYGWAEFLPPTGENGKPEMEYSTKFPMVMSIGFNPYFNNKYKTAEAHIMRKFGNDFYDSDLKVSVLGFIRTEADFNQFSHLIEAIHNDVQIAKDILLDSSQ